jgi:riboflavin biosynthesis pyrimidine reductase
VAQSAAAFLRALYAGGARTLLVHGGAGLAQPFLDAEAIDRVRAFLSSPATSRPNLDPPPGWKLLPPGFEIQRVDKIAGAVVIDALRGGDHIG